MASDLLVLGFDTSAAHCAAALLLGNRVLEARAEDMARGQAERLMPMIEDMLAAQVYGWGDLERIGVGIGPGNFSGIRIAVSAARGLALSLGILAIGVSAFEAAAVICPAGASPVVPAPQGQVYLQRGDDMPILTSRDGAKAQGLTLFDPPPGAELATSIARLAHAAEPPFSRPAPLYIKPADAAPPRDAPPTILDDPR